MNRRLGAGSPEPLGLTLDDRGANVAVFSAHATAIELCLFDAEGACELERIRLPERTGDVFHGHIEDLRPGDRYGLRAHGPFDPLQGQRFNPSKLLIDPFATMLDRPFVLHPSMFGYKPGDPELDLSFSDEDSGPFMPKAVAAASTGPGARAPMAPWSQTVVYEMHVRGFSKRMPGIAPEIAGTFAALTRPEAIEHLVKLGITTVEFMPAAAWIDERHLGPLGLTNYWGYNPVAWLAPDPRLAPGGWAEIAAATAALAEAGIESVLDVVLNHTGEGDALGPTLSLRGLDNASYYRLVPGEERHYIDDAGTGDTVALDRPPALRLAMDALRTWARLGGLSGFRFDLAVAMGRRDDGFDPAAPLLSAIAQDPELRDLKLIAEPWDCGPGGYQMGAFPSGWGEWNDRFRDTARRFWRGDQGQLGELATRLAGSQDLFKTRGRPSRSINFITAHDGFTLADLTAFEIKHNQANGENNRDGTSANWSWNNGVEGASPDPGVRAARLNDQRTLLATLFLARGTPMLAMGSELGQSQHGNNNAYAQDNEITWLDWEGADPDLLAFSETLIRLRHAHPALRADRFLSGGVIGDSGLPDVAWRRVDGGAMQPEDWDDPAGQTLVAVLGAPVGDATERVTAVFHRGPDPTRVVLPDPRDGQGWRMALDTARSNLTDTWLEDDIVEVAPRSVILAVEAPAPRRRARPPGAELLDRLAQAAGVAPDWRDVEGVSHRVGDDTKRALLFAMRMPSATVYEARESLARLSEDFVRRPLPWSITAREGQAAEARLPQRPGAGMDTIRVRIEGEDGFVVETDASGAAAEPAFAPDGGAFAAVQWRCPPLPAGRYRVVRDDAPEAPCRLTVAPARCFMPEALADGGRRWGLAAHLYGLRREGDQGIGDFTTLAEISEAAAAAGAATVGINPLHALFGRQRDRASPYHPSDRRFLDPMYVDCARLRGVAGTAPLDQIAALSSQPMVDYERAWTIKLAMLEQSLPAALGAPDARAEFDAFVATGGATLRRFAIFEALSEVNAGSWRNWPAGLRDPDSSEVEAFAGARADRVVFHQYLQWLAATQLEEAAVRGRLSGLTLGLYRDLAVGAAPDGAEAWANAGVLAMGVSIGAPPDPLGPQGQNWNLPPPDPWAVRRTGAVAFAELAAANMRHAGALRVDHVMGLERLFWIPDGASGADGAYVSYPFDDHLGQLALESARARCLVVGEDLGTLPYGLRGRLEAANVLSYRVLWFERNGDAFLRPAAYPAAAAACVSTHDLPTVAGWWSGEDIVERRALGLWSPEEADAAARSRETDKAALMRALADQGLVQEGPPPSEAPAAAMHAYLASSPAALVLAQVDDLAGETGSVNLPGTDRERPNWRRKVGRTIQDVMASPEGSVIVSAVSSGRKT